MPDFTSDIPDAGRDTTGADREPSLGHYEYVSTLGSGGMGIVHLVREPGAHREVALKIVRPDHLPFAGARRRFEREVAAISRLQREGPLRHDGIVPIFDVGELRGAPYYTMEYVAGYGLDRLIEDGPFTDVDGASIARRLASDSADDASDLFAGAGWQVACRIAARAADALELCHEVGIVHRDVKASNLLITAAGRVALIDFGLASAAGTDTITLSGAQVGSLAYMPPEQLLGHSKHADRRADVYSLGITLYEMLAGRPPYRDDDPERLRRLVLAGEVPTLRRTSASRSSCPAYVETIIRRAVDIDPNHRYASAADLANDLRAAIDAQPIAAKRVSVVRRVKRRLRRRPTLTTAAIALVLLTIATLIGLRLEMHRRQNVRFALAKQLEAEASDLRSVQLAMTSDIEDWLDRYHRLLEHRDSVTAELATIDEDDARAPLEEFLARLERLDDHDKMLQNRMLPFQHELDARLAAPLWQQVARDIAALPVYRRLDFAPQKGLWPLRRDPESGLWEFLHLASHAGDVDIAIDAAGHYALDASTGIILVLIPPFDGWVGAKAHASDPPEDCPRIDPRIRKQGSYPLPHRVTLDACFIGKYEMTWEQWHRIKSWHQPTPIARARGLEPMAGLHWERLSTRLERLGLELPSDDVWETACRATSDARYYTGDDADALRPFEWLTFDPANAPSGPRAIGLGCANRFGLHDMLGNLREWTADHFTATTTPGGQRSVRGGSYADDAADIAVTTRRPQQHRIGNPKTGARVMRRLD